MSAPASETLDVLDGEPVDRRRRYCANQSAGAAAYVPSAPTSSPVSFAAWLNLFTPAERAWAYDAARSVNIKDMILMGAAAGGIDLMSPTTEIFLDLCIADGGLTVERKAQVLAGQQPA